MSREPTPVAELRRIAREANRKTPIRLLRSSMTDTWYLVTRYRDLGNGRFIAETKQEVVPEDRACIEDAVRAVEP